MQALAAFSATLLLFIFLKEKKIILVNASLVLFILISILPFYIPKKQNRSTKKATTFFYSNVLTSNQNFSGLIELIKKEKPDIVGLIEVNDDWESHIHCDLDEYKYRVSLPHDDNFGVLLLSKQEIIKSEIKYFCNYDIPTIYAIIKTQTDTIHVVLTHTVPPTSKLDFEERNLQFENLNRFVKNKSNIIIAGDFNCSSFSANYSRILKKADLKDTRIGLGLQPTWPTWAPFLSVTLDHILVSKRINIINRKVLPEFGSDHLPVVLEYSL